ncbi:MAG TPA: IPT/TIG domain-containing protein [Burkholderiales bacterium]|nr:IPT/TIG domain-containing protein [Burkholderiales bacterium]
MKCRPLVFTLTRSALLVLASSSFYAWAQPKWGGDTGTQQRGFGVPTPQPGTLAGPAMIKPSAGGPVAEPTWPQRFALSPGGRTGFGFIAGQPGRIAVTVQSQGVPLVVSLVKPGGQRIDRQGAGTVSIEYTATPEDVSKGVIWAVSLRAAQEQKPGASNAVVQDRPLKLVVSAVANGTVNVQHPPSDLKRAQAELDSRMSKAAASRQGAGAPAAAALTDAPAQRQLALQQEQAARHAALLDQMRGKIPSDAHQKMSAQIAARAQARPVEPVAMAKGISSARPSAFAVPATSSSAQADTGTGTSGAPSTGGGASPVGSNTPASVAAAPTVSSLSVSEGEPGTPVLVTGRGFTNTPGEVHFIVAASRDLVAPVTYWSDTQVLVTVPDTSGVLAFNGQVYVKMGSQRSGLLGFRFIPSTETRVLSMTNDYALTKPSKYHGDGYVYHDLLTSLFGGKDDDEFFRNTRLKNGWVTDSAYLCCVFGAPVLAAGNGDAYIVEVRPGTDSPYLKVHWWADMFSDVIYRPQVVIRGPKGVPHDQ